MERTATGTFTGEKEYFTTPLGENHEFREGSGPYEYLMGALTGCFYYTLADYDRKGTWGEITITARGVKRTTPPTTLEHTSLEIVVKNISYKEEFELLVKKTSQSCSIFQTISKVSTMDIVVRFEDDEE